MATSGVRPEPPLVVIVGPTASGKSSLAIEVARQHDGEIISADSRAVYQEMDIGTAKPDTEDRTRAVHWGIDLVKPDERFSVANFQQYANDKIKDIKSRGKLPIVAGGTGLYVDSLLFDFGFGETKQKTWRGSLRDNDTIIVGIATPRSVLRARIAARTEQIFANNVVDEATKLGEKYGWDMPSMTSNIYPIIHKYLQKGISLEEAKMLFSTSDYRLSKRQMTWLRPNPHIEWCTLAESKKYLDRQLVVQPQGQSVVL